MGCFRHMDPFTNVCLSGLYFFYLQGRRNRVPYGCLDARFGAASSSYACNMGRGRFRGLVGGFTHINPVYVT